MSGRVSRLLEAPHVLFGYSRETGRRRALSTMMPVIYRVPAGGYQGRAELLSTEVEELKGARGRVTPVRQPSSEIVTFDSPLELREDLYLVPFRWGQYDLLRADALALPDDFSDATSVQKALFPLGNKKIIARPGGGGIDWVMVSLLNGREVAQAALSMNKVYATAGFSLRMLSALEFMFVRWAINAGHLQAFLSDGEASAADLLGKKFVSATGVANAASSDFGSVLPLANVKNHNVAVCRFANHAANGELLSVSVRKRDVRPASALALYAIAIS